MKNTSMLTVFFLSAACITNSTYAAPPLPKSVEIFTTPAFVVKNVNDVVKLVGTKKVIVYDVAAVAMIENEIKAIINRGGFGTNDPNAVVEVEKIARERIKPAMAQVRANERMPDAMKSLVIAYGYGIEKLPAVVFDRQAVAYGVTDLRDALRYYRDWKGTMP